MGKDHKDGYRRALLEGHRIDPIHPWGEFHLTDADRAEVEVGLGLRAPDPEPEPVKEAAKHAEKRKRAAPKRHARTE